MATLTMSRQEDYAQARAWLLDLTAPIGRVLFGLIFVVASLDHFHGETVAYAARHGVPFAEVFVFFSGFMELVGGLSILLGYKARWGAALLVAFLIPDTIVMHHFWALDAASAEIQRVMFLKNVGLFGGALMVLSAGSGPHSLDQLRLPEYHGRRPA